MSTILQIRPFGASEPGRGARILYSCILHLTLYQSRSNTIDREGQAGAMALTKARVILIVSYVYLSYSSILRIYQLEIFTICR
jgi:hypothetical protein